MNNKIKDIKRLIKKECENLEFAPLWFYDKHLLQVEKLSKQLLEKLPKADEEVVMLGVWLHDLQRIRGLKGDHQKIGANEAEKVMKNFGYDKDVIFQVKEAIMTHSCSSEMPRSLEAKILATADGMSHYYNDFFLQIAVTGQRDLKEYKEWVLEKLDRNYNKKIQFEFAKKMIKGRHDLYKKMFTLK